MELVTWEQWKASKRHPERKKERPKGWYARRGGGRPNLIDRDEERQKARAERAKEAKAEAKRIERKREMARRRKRRQRTREKAR